MLHITSFNGHQLISVISGRDVAAIERPFVFPAHLMSLLYLGKHTNAKIAPFKRCVYALPEFSQLLPDFFHIADLQLIFTMQYDSINLVL